MTNETQVQKLLKEFLKGVQSVDFNEMIHERGGSGDKITRQQKLVCVVDRLLEIVKDKKWGLVRNGDFVYAFNGQYWIPLDEQEFKTFLAKVAYKMSIPMVEAKQYQFQDQILKQFYATATLTTPIRDKDKVLINLKNGTYFVTPDDNGMKPFDRSDFLSYQLPFEYNPDATAPIFRAYLDRVLPEKELQDVLAEFMGYVFAKGLKLEKCLLLYGLGANGKSVFFDVMNALLGPENVSNFSLSNLSQEHNRALIANKLLNYGSELRSNIESDIFKQMASGEPIQCRLLYSNSFTISDYARLCFNCNDLPAQVEHNEAFFRRFVIIPFRVTIPENERDPELAKRIIRDELSGVFNWILEGVDRLILNKRFTDSEIVKNTIKEYKEQSDTAHCFLVDGGYREAAKPWLLKYIYLEYRDFCKEAGYSALNLRNFRKRLDVLGCKSVRRNDGVAFYLERRPPAPPDDEKFLKL